jgi:hypothetical protein
MNHLNNHPRLEKYAGVVGNYNNPYLKGTIGQSAYEIAVKNGFKGTEQEWLHSLSPYIGKNGNWFLGNEDTGVPASADISMIALTEEEILEICK